MNYFSYDNQSSVTYLVYSIDMDTNIDSVSLGMMKYNKIPGLAPILYTQMDTERYIRYNVTETITARKFLSGNVSKKMLISLLRGISEAVLSAEEYMIDRQFILFNIDYIYVDVRTFKVMLICLPVENMENYSNDIENFFREIMTNTKFDYTVEPVHIAEIFNYLNADEKLSLEKFTHFLDEIDDYINRGKIQNTYANIVPPQPSVMSGYEQNTMQYAQMYQEKLNPQPCVQNQVYPQSREMSEGQVVPDVQTGSDDHISWLYLMQHYNKENAEAYKAQKAAKKNNKQVEKTKIKKSKINSGNIKKPKDDSGKIKKSKVDSGIVIPGKNNLQNVPIPGKTANGKNENVGSSCEPDAPQMIMQNQAQLEIMNAVPEQNTANFGDTTVLSNGGRDQVSMQEVNNIAAPRRMAYLIRKSNNEQIALNKDVFYVGKDRNNTDYYIQGNSAISRVHAGFIMRDGVYCVVDQNSTNHTYVNGMLIQNNCETLIVPGDVIRLADEDFEFNLY